MPAGTAMNILLTIRAAIFMSLVGLAAAAPPVSAAVPPEAYSGPRKTVFVDVVGAAESMAGAAQGAGTTNDGLHAMLVEALIASGRFVVAERVALADIQLEQELARTGALTVETAAAPGRMLGASAIVYATVTKFGAATKGGALQLGLPFGRWLGAQAGASGQDAVVEFNLRIIDTSSGQVVATSTASGTASSSTATVSAMNQQSGANVGANTFRNTPLGEAAGEAINAAVRQIVAGMGKVPWSASVIAFEDGKVYVSAGAAQNVKPGMALHVYRKGKVLTDPGTGVVLEVLMTRVGAIEVQSASEKTSIATVTSGDPPVRGDIVNLGEGK
ncbi:MAG: hypothetical protein JWQ01_2751 [Massilia sp.]|nr:hypothetical protein [Massilia sp.]